VSPLILSDPAMWWVDGSSLLLIQTNSVTGSEEVVLWSLASSSVVRVRMSAGCGHALCHDDLCMQTSNRGGPYILNTSSACKLRASTTANLT
jgi:hypothetical protein